MFVAKWLKISFFNLFLVSVLGFLLRYKITFSIPFLDQKNLLHSHSHFAFSGWVTQTLMVLIIYYLSKKLGDKVFVEYKGLLYANLISSYGMLVAFILQGYALYSIVFSTLSILVSFVFAFWVWRDLERIKNHSLVHLWFKSALLFAVISTLGPFSLAYMMANHITDQDWYLGSVYFYLHFQYNGWFFFAGMGLLTSRLSVIDSSRKLYYTFYLFCAACVPAYFLSVLWLPFTESLYYLLIIAVLAQLTGWIFTAQTLFKNPILIAERFSGTGKILLKLAAIAFTLKLVLQSGSIYPQLSQLSYGFRPIIIGYLHLVLLAVTSIFIIGYILSLGLISSSKTLIIGVWTFVAGVIINELLLMLQGIGALTYTVIPHIQVMLFAAAVILMSGLCLLFQGALGTHPTQVKTRPEDIKN